MRLQLFAGLATALAVFLAPCSGSSGQLSEADRAAIKAVHVAFEAAVLANDVDAAFALYAADAVQLVPGQPPVRGKPAIVRRAKELMSDLTFVEREHRIEAIDGREDLAYVWGIIAQKVTRRCNDSI